MEIQKRDLKGLKPDESDRRNIIALIKRYDEKFPYPHPQSLQKAIQEGRKTVTDNVSGVQTVSKGDGGTVHAICLPQPFVIALKRAYPLIFSDKTQFDWFIKNFPNLTLLY